ncbi:MAG TPA: sugar phosphate nucleotidyltransferase [Polyangiaceae bacterium]|nr:sugar phosphate nucleotidyltransferase [Polyangiaceae bacterium]
MKAVILAGGKGTRLYPYTVSLPKPLVPIGEKPIIEIMLRQLHRAGVRDVTVSVGHLAEIMISFLGDGSQFDMNIEYVREDEPLGTVGPLRLVKDLPENFLLMNGDVLTNLSYENLFESHVASGARISISAYKKKVNIDLGVLVSSSGRVTEYLEKPTYTYDVSMGVYAMNRSVLSHIPEGRYFDFPMLIHALLSAGELVRTFPFDGVWFDIGRPADYEEAQKTFAELGERILPG